MWERVWNNERESAQQMIHATIKSQATEESRVVAFPNSRRVKLTMLPRRIYTHNISLSTLFFLVKMKLLIIFIEWVERVINLNY